MKRDEENVANHGSELDALLQRTESEEEETDVISSPRPPDSHQHRKTRSLFQFRTGPRRVNRHHRHKSSLGQLWGSMAESLSSIAEGVQAEAELFQQTLEDELNEADRGRRYFFDMSMTRSMSILPETFPDFVEETTGKEVPMDVTDTEAGVIGRYMGLLAAVLAVSSNGTALAMLKGVVPGLKLYWRMTATATVLSLFAAKNMYYTGFPRLSRQQWSTFAGAVVCFAAQTLLFYTALEYTSIGNAVIGANSQAILLILGKLIMGENVLCLEGSGVLLASIGAILCSTDEAEDTDPGKDSSRAVLGDVMALASGVMGVGYLTFAKAVRPHMSVTVFMFLMMLVASLLILSFLLLAGFEVSFSLDPLHGLFGWMTPAHGHIYIILHIAVICNVLGTMGFVRAMQYFDNIIIAVATLLEPLTATIIAYALGVGELPGPLGWTGNAFVVIGTLSVVYPSMDKTMEH